MQESETLDYYNFNTNGKYGLELEKIDNFNTPGTAHEYYDHANNVRIMVINSSDVPYISQYDDGEVIGDIEGEGRYFQEKKTINDKVVLVWVYDDDGQGLAQKIVESATLN